MEYPLYIPELQHLTLLHQGKTRDTYRALARPNAALPDRLIVATNRLSTHNVVHKSRVPFKSEVLNALTVFWMVDVLAKIGIPHHIVAFGVQIYDHLPGKRSDYPEDLHRRAIIARDLTMIPVEFIFRAYLAGSLHATYVRGGAPNPYGIDLPDGLVFMSPLEPPAFTPTDKSETDDPMLSSVAREAYPEATDMAARAFDVTRAHLRASGFEQIDAKFELGFDGERVVLADEHSFDSSRVCELSDVRPGHMPQWYDKQIARDAAERMWGTGPRVPLSFPDEVICGLVQRYDSAFERIVGMSLDFYQSRRLDVPQKG